MTDSTNKDKLEALIDEAKEMSEENYTKESFEALQRALEAAQVVFNNPEATQAEINAATETLQQALDSLVLVKTDKTRLTRHWTVIHNDLSDWLNITNWCWSIFNV